MEPVAVALDILQGEEKCYLGTIYPRIKSLERKLKKLNDLAKVSQPLVHALLVGLEKRFPTILNKRFLHARDYIIATASHPFFKLKWFPDNQKDVAVELLVDEAKKVEDFRSTDEADIGSFLSGDECFDLSDEETIRANSGNHGRETNSVKVEVLSYLNERRKELSVLKLYSILTKVFRKYNCIILLSTPAERLFSVGDGIFTPERNMLGDGMFEKPLLLVAVLASGGLVLQ